ncbi:hypothetical protein STEG23_008710, partial [Scotinomys teguina]
MPFNRRMDKENVVIYTMEYYAAEKNNDIMKFAGKWMELENVILSEDTVLWKIGFSFAFTEDENQWIASRLILIDQPRPPDSSSDVPTFRSASRQLAQKMKSNRLLQSELNHNPK